MVLNLAVLTCVYACSSKRQKGRRNLSGLFLWDLPISKNFSKWVTILEQGTSSVRTATFSCGTGMIWDGIAPISYETDIPLWFACHCLVVESGYTTRSWGWLLGRKDSIIKYHYPLYLLYRTKYKATEEFFGNIQIEYLVIDYRE